MPYEHDVPLSHYFWALHTATSRGIDEAKCRADVIYQREHGAKSEAHYHYKNEPCNERCIA